MTQSVGQLFEKLIKVTAQLRDPEQGCPWDLEQTHASLKPFLIEEAYEVIDAIDHSPDELAGELGDLLFQVLIHSQIGGEAGAFTITDVVEGITTKMIERHPHVFGERKGVNDAEQVLQNWEQHKKQERGEPRGVLDGVPRSLPALMRADLVGKRAARLGFDWSSPPDVLQKVDEELAELREAISTGAPDQVQEELGDLLFTVAQLGRKLGLDSEDALSKGVQKFSERFRVVEDAIDSAEQPLSPEEMEATWQRAKG